MQNKKGTKTTKTPPKTAIKGFALASAIGTTINVLLSSELTTPRLATLEKHSLNALSVFREMVGNEKYSEYSKQLGDVWIYAIDDSDLSLPEDAYPLFVEYLCSLLSPEMFKKFFGMSPYLHQNEDINVDRSTLVAVNDTLCAYNDAINSLLGTAKYCSPFVPKKKPKIKKERSKAKSKNTPQSKTSTSKKKFALKKKKKEENLSSLREIIMKAQEKKASLLDK